MVETVVAVVIEVGKCLAAPIGRQFMYLYNYKSNFDNLKNEVDKLKDTKEQVKHKVDDAERNVEEIKQSVQKWQESVNSIIDEAEKFIQEQSNNHRCFNLINRYKHSRKASKKMKAVIELLQEQGTFGHEVSHPTTHEDIRLISNKDYEAFESRNSTLNDVLKVVNDAEVDMIGVYGMGGIGKTTLVKEVGKQAKEGKLFDEVVFVEVTDTPDIKKIQQEIAYGLGLTFDNETESQRANKLYARLKKGEKILIILDNIWEELDLMTVGIPSGAEHGGCKLLLTARDLNVLSKMESTTNFKMGVLNKEEAWRLFKKMAGDVTEIRELQTLQNDICNECGGLPIAIVTVAKALAKKRDLFEWDDALLRLKRPSPENFKGDLKMAYSKIELSYNYLSSENLKKTFLLCSLMGHQGSISELVKYVMGLDIFKNIYTMKEARIRVNSLVKELKDCCLLLDGKTNESFSMHDFVREVAISIANRDEQVLNFRNESDWQWSGDIALDTCTKVFIRDSSISKLVGGLECPQLESFFMNTNTFDSRVEIPDNFFIGMTKLKVLDLNRMRLSSLQSSLHLLVNLQTLCLDYSKFEDVAIIGELNKLKILSLRGSKVEKLPKEIGQLTQLRLLDLSDCKQLYVIAPNVLSSLFRLEELYMSSCSVFWEAEGRNVERRNASLEELKHLSQLTTLEIDIKHDRILPKGLFSKKLERYNISIGDMSSTFYNGLNGGQPSFASTKTLRTLKVELYSIIWSKELENFKNVELLRLYRLNGVENVLYELDKEGFSELKHLYVNDNPNLLYIVDTIKYVPCDAFSAFPLLESLTLLHLIRLEKICYGQPTAGSFCSLKIIVVESCRTLKNIFSFSDITQILPQLERIRVKDCKDVKEIFAIEREENVNNINEVIDEIKFCQLRFLTLNNLPRLTRFCLEVKTSSTLQSNDINLEDEIEPLKSLFNEKLVFPKLEVLELFGLNSEKMWDSQLQTMSSCYQNLSRLIIRGCHKLKYAFPSSIIQSFKQLQHLEIEDCMVLKEIVTKGREEEADALFVFPRVIFLKLKNLPELTSFYPGIHTSKWPMLEKLEVCNCDKVKIFTSKDNEGQLDISEPQSLFFIEKINSNMKQLKLSRTDNMMTQQEQLSENLICRFKVLKIIGDKSANIPLGIIQKCNNLEKLMLDDNSYQEIFSSGENEKHGGKQDSKPDSILQKLKVLRVHMCHGLLNVLPSSVSFQNLTVLEVRSCNGLVNLLTASTVKSLMQLTEMKIEACRTMVEIVENEGDVADEIVFNKLKLLSLENLDSLVYFSFGNCTLKFLSLEEIIVSHCCEMKAFFGGDLRAPRLRKVKQSHWINDKAYWEGDLNTTIQQLHEKEMNSNLKKLTLSGKDIRLIRQGQFPEYGFDELEIVKDDSASISIEILQRINNFKTLTLKASSYKELFSCGEDKKHARTFTRIKFLEVLHCCNLITLMPSSTSFENLTTLMVWHCHGLKDLVTSSTAKSLVQLEKMDIVSCKMMIEVVANEGDKDEIVFRKLRSLSLRYLESLTSFCSGNYTFKFPSLEELFVEECSKMKAFSEGVLSTPILEKVMILGDDYEEDEFRGCWEGDLNTTIQQFYKMVVCPNLEALKLIKFESEKIWDNQLPTSMSCYQNLTCLILWYCGNLRYVFPSSIVRSFEQLQHIEICRCWALKEIVAKEEEMEAVTTFVFPQVTFLRLDNLPRLTSFHPGKHTSEWPLLKYLEVCNCDEVKIFTSEYLNFHESTGQQSLFLIEKINPDLNKLKINRMDSMMTRQCQFSENLMCRFKLLEIRDDDHSYPPLEILERCNNLIHLKLENNSYDSIFSYIYRGYEEYTRKQDSKLETLLQSLEVLEVRRCKNLIDIAPLSASFQNLTVLTVKGCNLLSDLISSSTAKSLVQLTEMQIEGCKRMKEIIENQGDVAEDEIVFNKLKWLSLEKLKSLLWFSFGNYTLKFPSLEELIVEECPKMETFSGGVLSTPNLQKVWKQDSRLNIEGCLEGQLNTIIQQLSKEAIGYSLPSEDESMEDLDSDF